MSSLLNLPIELLENVFNILDDKSLLAMRMVSNVTKKMAETTVLNRHGTPTVDCLRLIGKTNGEIITQFLVDKTEGVDGFLSKFYLVSVVNYLEVRCIYDEKEICITLNSADTIILFNQITPLMSDAKCEAFEFFPSTLQMISLTSTFFEGKCVPEIILEIKDPKQSGDFILKLIGQLHSVAIRLYLDVSIFHIDDFLIKLAESVDSIAVNAPISDIGAQEEALHFRRMQSLVNDILKSRCFYLDFTDGFINMPLHEARILSVALASIPRKQFYVSFPTSPQMPSEDASLVHRIQVVKEEHRDRHLIEIGNVHRAEI